MTSGSQGELVWRRAKACESGACVEVAIDVQRVLLRSSKDPDGKNIAVTRDEWRRFISSIKVGIFE